MIDLSVPLGGVASAQNRFNRSADRISRASLPGGEQPGDQVELTTEAVALLESRNAFEANLNVIHVADEMNRATMDLIG